MRPPRVDVVTREELWDLLSRLEDQRPLIGHMVNACRVHDELTPPHRCNNAACAQVVEFKAVLMAAAERLRRN